MINEPKVYVVGRESKNSTADILIPGREDTVSRCHVDLTISSDGRYYINEPAPTANGTFMREQGNWNRVSAGYVGFRAPIRLGNYETTVESLLKLRSSSSPPDHPSPPPLPQQAGTEIPNGAIEPYWDDEAGKMRYE